MTVHSVAHSGGSLRITYILKQHIQSQLKRKMSLPTLNLKIRTYVYHCESLFFVGEISYSQS